MTRKLIISLAALALAGFALVACGDDDSDDGAATTAEPATEATTDADTGGDTGGGGTGGGAGGSVDVEADPGGALAYTSGDLTTEAGEVEINFDNPSSVPHDVRIESDAGEDVGGTEVITESSETATVELDPGTYTYYCSVGGHRAAGMEGTLTVE